MSILTDEFLKNESLATKPWPKNSQLYQPYEEEQILLAENASCLAVRTYLKMLKLPFTVEQCSNAEFISPGGRRTKLPVLRVDNFTVAEFEPILNLVELKGNCLSRDLDAEEKLDMRAYLYLVEQTFTNAEQYISWVDEEVFTKVTKQRNGCVYAFPLNHIQNFRKRRSVMKQLSIGEFSNLEMAEVVNRVEKCCKSLYFKLGDKPYFYGNEPTELDALVFGHLFSIFTMTLPNQILAETINKYSNLTNFCKNVDATYFNV